MNPEELLAELSGRNVIIKAADNKLRIDAPKGVLTSELRQAIAEQKLAILTLMQRNVIQLDLAPTIQDTEAQESELDELIEKLKPLNRHHHIEKAKEKNVPMKALLHAAQLWLSDDDTKDWTAANDTIFSFTSPYGQKRSHYPRPEPPSRWTVGDQSYQILEIDNMNYELSSNPFIIHIRQGLFLKRDDISRPLLNDIASALTIENPAYQAAVKAGRWTGGLNKFLP